MRRQEIRIKHLEETVKSTLDPCEITLREVVLRYSRGEVGDLNLRIRKNQLEPNGTE